MVSLVKEGNVMIFLAIVLSLVGLGVFAFGYHISHDAKSHNELTNSRYKLGLWVYFGGLFVFGDLAIISLLHHAHKIF